MPRCPISWSWRRSTEDDAQVASSASGARLEVRQGSSRSRRGRQGGRAGRAGVDRGFNSPFKARFQVVNLDRLAELYPDGGEVTVESLAAKGAVRPQQPVKVLGTGEISVAVQVTAHAFSGSAKEKIEASGGTVTTV